MKGAAHEATVDRIVRGLREMGVQAPATFKTDNEPAIKALRDELARRLGPSNGEPGIAMQDPPAHESESHGAAENGVLILKGLIRTHVLALEAKLGVTFPVDHPMVAWIVEAVGDMATKHLRGHDGRTGYERLYGKPARDEGFELGERVLWKRPKAADQNVELEARWEEGIWLGRRWGSITHLVGDGDAVFDARAVQRRPREDRWSVDLVQRLRATPWLNPAPPPGARGEPALLLTRVEAAA